MENIQQTALSQYANSDPITSIIDGRNQAIDPAALIDQWYANVWDIRTAIGWGLDVWGRIVNQGRSFAVPASGIRYGLTNTDLITLDDTDFRALLFCVAAANIWDGTIPGAEAALSWLTGSGSTPVIIDNLDMTESLIWSGDLVSSVWQGLIAADRIGIRPAGVLLDGITVPSGNGKLFAWNTETSIMAGWNEAVWSAHALTPAALGLWCPGLVATVTSGAIPGSAAQTFDLRVAFPRSAVGSGASTVQLGAGGADGSGVSVVLGATTLWTAQTDEAAASFADGVMSGLAFALTGSAGTLSCAGDTVTLTSGGDVVMTATLAFPACNWIGN